MAAVLALLVAMPMLGLPLLHRPGDDPCSSSPAEYGASALRISAGTVPVGSPHCSICHLWHSGGRFREHNQPSTLTSFIDFGLVAKTFVGEPGLIATASRPARAPPAS